MGMAEGFSIGLDLGGTRLKAAAVSHAGAVLDFEVRDSGARHGPRAPLLAMVEAVRTLSERAGARPRAIGVGVPGAVDPATGILRGTTPHLPHWRDFPVRAELEALFGRGLAVDNDANAAAWAEHRAGAARGTRASLTVCVGTGLGGGYVAQGRLLRGAWGGAGELGHLPLGSGALACRCGVPNCVEPEASGSGIVRLADARGLAATDARDVFAAAAAGEPRAAAVVAHVAERLGAAIATATTLLNPELVVLAGGLAEAGETFVEGVRRSYLRHVLPANSARLERAAFGERAGAVGAALLGWERVGEG